MPTCPACESAVDTLYDCQDCGGSFCVDCRLPDDHECEPTQNDSSETSGSLLPGFLGDFRWYHHLIALLLFGFAITGSGVTGPSMFAGAVVGGLVVSYALVQGGRAIAGSRSAYQDAENEAELSE